MPGFDFSNHDRNAALHARGLPLPKATSTGTTIVGCIYDGGVVVRLGSHILEVLVRLSRNVGVLMFYVRKQHSLQQIQEPRVARSLLIRYMRAFSRFFLRSLSHLCLFLPLCLFFPGIEEGRATWLDVTADARMCVVVLDGRTARNCTTSRRRYGVPAPARRPTPSSPRR